MTDLTTQYLGLTLRNPVVASAGPLSQTVAGVKSLADGGVGAVVLYSLFEEQLRREAEATAALEEMYEDSFAEALSYFPTVPRVAHPSSPETALIARVSALCRLIVGASPAGAAGATAPSSVSF